MNSYETDYAGWANEQAALLRAGSFHLLDIAHLTEELETIMGNERRELYRRLRVLIGHLLKWKFQPEARSASWEGTMRVQRKDIARLFKQSPSLRRFLQEEAEDAYRDALELASIETGFPETAFPMVSPFTTQEILDKDFWPD